MHRREHSGLAWHDDPDAGEHDAHRAPRWPTARDRALPDDDLPHADADPHDDVDRAPASPHHDIEESLPASARLRAALEGASARVRRSVPLRSALFVLPPLLLPPALGLSLGASLVATLLLLWLAAAAALLATIMFDGSDQLALRAIDRRLQALEAPAGTSAVAAPTSASGAQAPAVASTGGPPGDTEDALLAIGSQLDRLNDRLDELATAGAGAHRPDDHRPAEQWSGQPHPGQDVGTAPDRGVRQWGEPRWQGPMH